MKECDKEISGIMKELQKLEHKISESNLERKRMENEVFFLYCLWLALKDYVLNDFLTPSF